MKTIKITVQDVLNSQRSTLPSQGQLERLEQEVAMLFKFVECAMSTLTTKQLLDLYVSLNGDTEHYDWDKRVMDEVSFGTGDSE